MNETDPTYTATYPDAPEPKPAPSLDVTVKLRGYLMNERRRTIAKLNDLNRMLGLEDKGKR